MAVGAYALTTREAVKAYLGMTGSTDDTFIDSAIDRVSARIDGHCRRYFVKRTYTSEYYDGTDSPYLLLRNWPIVSVASVIEDGLTLTVTTDYELIADEGQIFYVEGHWSKSEPRNIKVTYDAGYVFPSVATAAFTGSGLNDATSGGSFTGTASAVYTIIIDGVSTANTFKWKKDSGSYTTGVAITGTAQTLSDGVTVTFGATGGHTLSDQWTVAAQVRTLPYDLEDAVIKQVVKEVKDRKGGTPGVSSKSMPDGSMSYSMDAQEWLPEVLEVLRRYRRLS